MLEFTPNLNEALATPLYLQLYQYIREEISSGIIPAGSRLPSLRKLATHLNISRNTVETAYQQLIAEGYVESRPRSGVYVIEVETPLLTTQTNHSPFTLEQNKSEPQYRYDFRYGNIAIEQFPFHIWRKLTNQCLNPQATEFFQYGDPQGDDEIRVELATYLRHARGVRCVPEQIIIGAGIQQLLQLLSLILDLSGQKIALEEPGYDGSRAVFKHYGAFIQPIPLEKNGLQIEALYQSKAKFVYVTPSHQFPCGMVMPFSIRIQLLHWAEEENGLIIEDDYDGEFRYAGKPIPSLQGLDSSGKVVYLGTFSKSLLPSIRISYMVLPPSLLVRYQQNFRLYQQPVSRLHQKTLQLFMQQGYWIRHIRKMRNIYHKRYLALLKAIEQLMGHKVTIIGEGAGLHILLAVHNGMSEAELIEQAQQREVRVYPISRHWSNPSKIEHPMVQLGFGGLSEEEIFEGIRLLKEAWFSAA